MFLQELVFSLERNQKGNDYFIPASCLHVPLFVLCRLGGSGNNAGKSQRATETIGNSLVPRMNEKVASIHLSSPF